jgi:hypothetical protein
VGLISLGKRGRLNFPCSITSNNDGATQETAGNAGVLRYQSTSRGEKPAILEMNTKSRVLLIIFLVVSIVIPHYFKEMSEHKYHILYQGLFFLPVMLAGFCEAPELHLVDEKIDRFIQESLAVVETVAKDRQVRIESYFLGKIAPVPLDGMRIKQVLIDLVVNAFQASPEGETVMVACHLEQRRIVIDVRDLRSGVAEDRRELIFSPFFTTKKKETVSAFLL